MGRATLEPTLEYCALVRHSSVDQSNQLGKCKKWPAALFLSWSTTITSPLSLPLASACSWREGKNCTGDMLCMSKSPTSENSSPPPMCLSRSTRQDSQLQAIQTRTFTTGTLLSPTAANFLMKDCHLLEAQYFNPVFCM